MTANIIYYCCDIKLFFAHLYFFNIDIGRITFFGEKFVKIG